MRWHFARPAQVQRQRNSKLDDHFAGSGTDRAGDLTREGTQNAGDAAKLNDDPVRIRIGFGELQSAPAARYAQGLTEHLAAIAALGQLAETATVTASEPCAYLTFEDFNTTGLTGDPLAQRRYDHDPANAFHTFFRAEGQTDKVNENKQGSHGIGKIAFMSASHIRAVLGLTCRNDDNRELLFGTAVLRTHRLMNDDYDGDAWFGSASENEAVRPTEDAEIIAQFRRDFSLNRRPGEHGFSVVVPWLNREEVTPDRVVDAILRGHALPILRKKLIVEVAHTPRGPLVTIDSSSFLSVLESRTDDSLKTQVRPMAVLAAWALRHPPSQGDQLALPPPGAPKWSDPTLISAAQRDRFRRALDAEEPISLRVPVRIRRKGLHETQSHFDVFLCRAPGALGFAGPTVQFVRDGQLIVGMGRRITGVRALVVVSDLGLAGLLRAAENPSHTRWSSKSIKDQYTFAPGTLTFVLDSVKEIAKLLAGDPTEKDASIWANEMSLPRGGELHSGQRGVGLGTRGGGRTTGQDGGTGGPPPPPPPPPKPKRPYAVTVIVGGFAVRPSGRPFPCSLPVTLELRLAYHVRGSNPLSRWNYRDFDLSLDVPIQLETRGCRIVRREGNLLVVDISDADFEFRAFGFDTRRELYCKPRLHEPRSQTDSDVRAEGRSDQNHVLAQARHESEAP